ncbi:MAG: hypothetical protein CM15mP53_03690 [Ectothiorhodospiraceae bacterium]|nr:MAG: hypothetical protein CM15mP53_03690 [Ectothiorhodospiraceae bacterium]
MRSILFIAIAFLSMQVIADDKARPGPHNKIGHTKKDAQEKKDTFFYKLFNDESDIMGSNNKKIRVLMIVILKYYLRLRNLLI